MFESLTTFAEQLMYYICQQYSPDWCARKDIEKLEVTCPRREKGCTWEGKLSNLGSHQKDVCKLQNPSICGETIIHDEIDTPLADCTKMVRQQSYIKLL